MRVAVQASMVRSLLRLRDLGIEGEVKSLRFTGMNVL
jgi:hypothetical protein